MKVNKSPKLALDDQERKELRKNKIRLSDIHLKSVNDLCVTFQSVPSIGPAFAKDLILLGYYDLDELKTKDGASLFDKLEELYMERIDPCVEDQCRFIVFYANHQDCDKQWWDFTEERKNYRHTHGYPNRLL